MAETRVPLRAHSAREALALGADTWGRMVGACSLRVVSGRLEVMAPPLPDAACLWIGWHEYNLIALAVHRIVVKRPVTAFVPSHGLRATAMRSWLEHTGVAPIAITARTEVSALRQMSKALQNGLDAVVAMDGPAGPRRVVKKGIFWLASHANVEIRAIGSLFDRPFGCLVGIVISYRCLWPALQWCSVPICDPILWATPSAT